jgi:uncharacterized membrane protein
MGTKKGKYDTNPLDPELAKKTEEVWGESDDSTTQEVKGATREVGSSLNDSARSNIYSEAPTRRYDNPAPETPYPSVFVPPTYSPPVPYQPAATPYQPPPLGRQPTSRTVPGIGLSEKWATILPYAPFYIGVVVSLLELFLVPRKEGKVRFHASQGLALHLGILIIQTLFNVLGAITNSSIGGTLFKTAASIFLVISMIRVAKGEPHRIAPLAEPAQWFNERIDPRNQA